MRAINDMGWNGYEINLSFTTELSEKLFHHEQ